MTTRARKTVGFLLLILLSIGGFVLLRAGIYGWTMFVLIPVAMGGVAAWALTPATGGQAASDGAVTSIVASCLLLGTGLEGVICVMMTLPLAMPLGALGGWLVYLFNRRGLPARGVTILLLLPPAAITWDVNVPPEVFQVRTEIVVAAPPEKVWKHVVSFSALPEPTEWFFRAGIGYPKRARIEVSGSGAIRYCEFSTGPFVEPIEVWDEPRLLRFRVTENPPPIHEWSPYAEVLPKHLHGYLVSKQGEFRLTRLTGNRTLLEGTTWYQHGLWPATYWRLWSDAIIHRIHWRVLSRVRTLAEQEKSERSN